MVKNNAYAHTNKTCLPPCFGKKLPQTGEAHARRSQPPPTALQAPSVARRHRRPHHPAGTPGRKQQQRPLPCPPCVPRSPGFVVVTAQAAGRILTGTGGERARSEPGRRELRSAEAAPSLAAAPLLRSPARRRAGRGGASAGREGSRDLPWEGSLRITERRLEETSQIIGCDL